VPGKGRIGKVVARLHALPGFRVQPVVLEVHGQAFTMFPPSQHEPQGPASGCRCTWAGATGARSAQRACGVGPEEDLQAPDAHLALERVLGYNGQGRNNLLVNIESNEARPSPLLFPAAPCH
jgi:hypothetical protein